MKNLMQRKTIYKRYAVNYMHVGILYANVFTELCSINETSAFSKFGIRIGACTDFPGELPVHSNMK